MKPQINRVAGTRKPWLILISWLLLTAPAAVQAQFTYTTNASGATLTITGYANNYYSNGSFTLPIPTNINGLTVTSIGDSAFDDSAWTNIIMPNTISNIGTDSFTFCSRLASITLPEGITSLNFGTFSWCISLASVTIPSSVTDIGDDVFMLCSDLASIIIPSNVTTIGDSAFVQCSSLTNVAIPGNVTNIGDGAFGICTSLVAITVDTNNPFYTSVNGVLFDKDQSTLIQFPGGRGGSYTIPSSVANIENGAFEGCGLLTNVTIPTNVASIGAGAFGSCNSLTNVTIPDSVTNIGGGAFGGCLSLTAIAVNPSNSFYSSVNGVLFPHDQTMLIQFPGDAGGNYSIPTGITSIGGGAFSRCYNLTGVSIPAGVTNIGDEAFYQCTGLTDITIPSTVTSIGEYAFYQCFGLTNFYFLGNAPTADSTVFYSVGIDGGTPTVFYLAGTTGWSTNFAGLPAVELSTITITPSPTNGMVPLTVNFTSAVVNSDGHAVSNWNWNFGDGSTSTAQNPTHTFTASGTFSVSLIETNSNGVPMAGAAASITANTPPQPVFAGASLSGANLVFGGSNGLSGVTYYVLMCTNLALPLVQWTPVATNVLSASGNFTITASNTVHKNVPQAFYILQTP